jgi:tRNA nucleotidyltransferase (CCA-adding enzyme)
MKVLKEVLEQIKPSKKDVILVEGGIKEFMSKIKVKDAKIILGGSGAKDTWLKDAKDADIFVQFSYDKYKDKSDELSDILEKQLKKSFKGLNRLHGSRDYFQVKKENAGKSNVSGTTEGGFTFEIIPILEVKKSQEALNITDVSPLHALFVKKEVAKKKKLSDEIRLMKQFCKASEVYGAESYINGFSGYMCELLVIKYGGFLKLVKAASKWKESTVIDIKNFYKGRSVFLEMNKSKIVSPLILIDPVQKDRNAAAALSFEKFDLFRKICKEFLTKPSVKFFECNELDINKLKEFVVLEINPLDGKEDVVGAKLVKVFNFLKSGLSNEGFVVKDKGWTWDKEKKAYFYFKSLNIDKIKILKGPLVSFKDHVLNFKKKHKTTFVKSKVVYAKEKRKIIDAKSFVKDLIKEKYVKERVKSIRLR